MRRYILILIIFLVSMEVFFLPGSGEADSKVDKINEEIKRIQKQINVEKEQARKTEEQINLVNKQKTQNKQDLNQVLKQMDQTGRDIEILKEKIAFVNSSLEKSNNELQETESRIEERDKILRSRLRLLYTNGTVSYLEVLFQATSFSDFLDRYDFLRMIVSQDRNILTSLRRQ